MELKYVIIINPGDVRCYSPSYMTYLQTLEAIKIQTKIILIIEHASILKSFNLSSALVATKICQANSWTALMGTYITEQLLEFYVTEIPKLLHYQEEVGDTNTVKILPLDLPTNKKLVRHYSCDDALDIQLGYVSFKNDPSLRNKNSFKWNLGDIVFTKLDTHDSSVNFDNCIPIVNGVARWPTVYENELYAIDSTALLASAGNRNSNVSLIDFTPVGDIETIKFTECAVSVVEENLIQVALPDGVSLQNKTPILVIEGRLFFAHELHQVSKFMLSIDLARLPLQAAAVRNDFLMEKFSSIIPVVDIANIKERLLSTAVGQNASAFIIIVDNPSIDVLYTRPLYKSTVNSFFFPKNSHGILTSTITRDIIDFVNIPYEDNDLLTMSLPIPGKLLPCRQNETGAIAIEYTTDKQLEYKDIGTWDVKLINLTG